jgi:hypothetical protein
MEDPKANYSAIMMMNNLIAHANLIHSRASLGCRIPPLQDDDGHGLIQIKACRQFLERNRITQLPDQKESLGNLVAELNELAWGELSKAQKNRFFPAKALKGHIPFIANMRMLPMASTLEQADAAATLASRLTCVNASDEVGHESDWSVVDLFAGSGMNAWQLAKRNFTVIACEANDQLRDILKYNLAAVGVLSDNLRPGGVFVSDCDAKRFVASFKGESSRTMVFVDAPWVKPGSKVDERSEDSRWGYDVDQKDGNVTRDLYSKFHKCIFKVSRDIGYAPVGLDTSQVKLTGRYGKATKVMYKLVIVQFSNVWKEFGNDWICRSMEEHEFEFAGYREVLSKFVGRGGNRGQGRGGSRGQGRGSNRGQLEHGGNRGQLEHGGNRNRDRGENYNRSRGPNRGQNNRRGAPASSTGSRVISN